MRRRKSRDADRWSAFLDIARQRIPGAVIEIPDLFRPEPLSFDQKVRAGQDRGGQALDDEAHGFRSGVEPLVLGPALGGPAATQEQFRRDAVIEAVEIARLLADTVFHLPRACHEALPTLLCATRAARAANAPPFARRSPPVVGRRSRTAARLRRSRRCRRRYCRRADRANAPSRSLSFGLRLQTP